MIYEAMIKQFNQKSKFYNKSLKRNIYLYHGNFSQKLKNLLRIKKITT